MNNNYKELNQQNINNMKRINQKIAQLDDIIRRLANYKRRGKLAPNKVQEYEQNISYIISELKNIFQKSKFISLNIDLSNKFMDLLMLWDSYKKGLEIKSREEEEMEANNLLNNIMAQHNNETYGTGRK